MIGNAIHTILKNKIISLSTGKIFPIIMPQNAKYKLGASENYPAVIYHHLIDYQVSKDKRANIIKAEVTIEVISKTYKETNNLSKKIKDILDQYQDLTDEGLTKVKGFIDINGYKNNYVNNINISNIFYIDEKDDYYDELYLFTRALTFNVYYYDNIEKLNYNNNSISSPLMISLDSTQITDKNNGALMYDSGDKFPSSGTRVRKIINKLGKYNAKETPTSSKIEYSEYLLGSSTSSLNPAYYNITPTPFLNFAFTQNLRAVSSGFKNISLSSGALFIMVYRPSGTSGENYILGNQVTGEEGNVIYSHKKVGSNITIHFNPCGDFTAYSSRTISLATSTDSSNFWDADIHFMALSLGGNKAQTGGSYNNSGWFEYFNSNYNPKLTTGQIIKDNSFDGNSNTYSNSLTFASIGGNTTSMGFNLYELLIFAPNAISTHNINADASPFQPTDIIYKQIKDYIYNKYKSLN